MIELRGLQKIVEQHTAIDIDELVVEPGEIVALFGPAILHEPRVLLLQEPFARCDESIINLRRSDRPADRDDIG